MSDETERERIHDGWRHIILVYILVGALCLFALSTCKDCAVRIHIKVEQSTPAPIKP